MAVAVKSTNVITKTGKITYFMHNAWACLMGRGVGGSTWTFSEYNILYALTYNYNNLLGTNLVYSAYDNFSFGNLCITMN